MNNYGNFKKELLDEFVAMVTFKKFQKAKLLEIARIYKKYAVYWFQEKLLKYFEKILGWRWMLLYFI